MTEGREKLLSIADNLTMVAGIVSAGGFIVTMGGDAVDHNIMRQKEWEVSQTSGYTQAVKVVDEYERKVIALSDSDLIQKSPGTFLQAVESARSNTELRQARAIIKEVKPQLEAEKLLLSERSSERLRRGAAAAGIAGLGMFLGSIFTDRLKRSNVKSFSIINSSHI